MISGNLAWDAFVFAIKLDDKSQFYTTESFRRTMSAQIMHLYSSLYSNLVLSEATVEPANESLGESRAYVVWSYNHCSQRIDWCSVIKFMGAHNDQFLEVGASTKGLEHECLHGFSDIWSSLVAHSVEVLCWPCKYTLSARLDFQGWTWAGLLNPLKQG